MATFTIYVPEQDPLQYSLDGIEQLSFGRGPENDVVIDHVSLSGSHAVIQNVDGNFQVTDLGSTNGTFLDGQPVTEATLAHGARVMFGTVEAVFAEGEEVSAEAPAVADAAGGGAGEASHSSGHGAVISDVSNRPADFKNLSPIEKVVKKDLLGQIAMIFGVVAILATVAVVALSAVMKAS